MMLALVCMIHLVFPGVIVLILAPVMKRSRAIVAALFVLVLALELGALSYL